MLNLKTIALGAVIALGAGAANAATVTTYCPGTAETTDREFSVTIEGPDAATCVLYGPGNTDTPDNKALIEAAVGDATLLDKSDEVGASGVVVTYTGSLSGLWEIILPAGTTLTNAFIAFKVGVADLNPDWALFGLPDGTLSGSWSVSGQQGLSHVSLYGTLAPIPLPAAGFLMLGALGALGVAARRRKA